MDYYIVEIKESDISQKPAQFTIQDNEGVSAFAGSILECEGWVRLKERDTKINLILE